METKVCHVCKKELSLSSFYDDNRAGFKTGVKQSRCKKCRSEYNKRYKSRRKLYFRRANKKARGLTLEQFNVMLKQQKGLCLICGLPEVDRNQHGIKDLAIDHNHNTNKVRGLLCSKCNRALGLFNVDNLGVLNLQKAIEYLRLTGTT